MRITRTISRLLLLIFLGSCSSGVFITQRRYNNGFNIEWGRSWRSGKDTAHSLRDIRIAEVEAKRKFQRVQRSGMDSLEIIAATPSDPTSRTHLEIARLHYTINQNDSDSIIYYRKPKKVRAPLQQQPKVVNDTLHKKQATGTRNRPKLPEQDNKHKYEKNATIAIVLFFGGFVLLAFGGFFALIAACIVAGRSKRYFREYPDSQLKGRGWADFIYIFGLILLILSLVLAVILLLAILAFFG